jgi:thymidine kinase
MWSGKTFHIIRLARRYRAIGKRVLFVDHVSDNRYLDSDLSTPVVVTHDGIKEKCIFLENLHSLLQIPEYADAQVVVIEEAQFFPDTYDFISRECDISGKEFIVSGLSGDYQRKPIGDILTLIPHAEFVDKLNGLCNQCKDGTVGCFTQRHTDSNHEQIAIGAGDMYDCVCRKHYSLNLRTTEKLK